MADGQGCKWLCLWYLHLIVPGLMAFLMAFVLQSSPDLYTWTPVATNILSGSVPGITNPMAPGAGRQFWRVLSQP